MSAAALLERLERVHQVGTDRWRAICPAHESRNRTQSLAVRELGDGTVLIWCFAGCGVADVLAAVGLGIRELFPDNHVAPLAGRKAQRPRHWHAIREAVQTLELECLVVAIAAERAAAGDVLGDVDRERMVLAATRVRSAIRACL